MPWYIACVFLLGVGAFFFGNNVAHPPSSHHHHMHAQVLELEDTTWRPTVLLKVEQDLTSGWNVYLTTENFVFAPENVNREHKEGEGHAHLYLNDEKIARLYGKWFHIPHLEKGEHTLSVTLNSNDHRTLAVSGTPVRDETIFSHIE